MKCWVTRDRHPDGDASENCYIWIGGPTPYLDGYRRQYGHTDWRAVAEFVQVCADGFQKALGVEVDPDQPIQIEVKLADGAASPFVAMRCESCGHIGLHKDACKSIEAPYLLVVGNIEEGFQHIGPFQSKEAAGNYYRSSRLCYYNDGYEVVTLQPPKREDS